MVNDEQADTQKTLTMHTCANYAHINARVGTRTRIHTHTYGRTHKLTHASFSSRGANFPDQNYMLYTAPAHYIT